MRIKGMGLIVLAGLLGAGCSLQGEAQTQSTIILNEDMQLESSLADSRLNVQREDDLEVSKNATYWGFKGQDLYYNENGALHWLNAETGETEKVADMEAYEVLDSGKMALSSKGEEIYVQNLETGKKQFVTKGSRNETYKTYFTDKDGTVATLEWRSSEEDEKDSIVFDLFDPETGKTDEWDLSSFFSLNSFTYNSLKKDGSLYFAAENKDGEYGIYQIARGTVPKTAVALKKEDASLHQYDILQDGTILFGGSYQGKSGVFLTDKDGKKVNRLVAGGRDEEGEWIPTYSLSPDETKILFDTPVQVENEYKTNVYMGEIVDGELLNTVRIMENADLYAVVSMSGKWSDDSNTAYIAQPKGESDIIGSLAKFKVE